VKRIHYCYLLTRALPEGGSMYYVGIRTCPVGKTPETDTSYMGSGRRITRAVKAHRREFTKTIVDVFDTRDEAKAMERALVGLPTANSPWSYNLRQGGEDAGLLSEETKAKIGAARRSHLADPAELEAQRERNRAQAKDPAWQAAHAAGQRRPEVRAKQRATHKRLAVEDPTRCEQLRVAGKAGGEASRAPEVRAKISATKKRLAAAMTDEERRQMTDAPRRAKAERARVQREVQWILAALIVNNYGGAEAA